MLTACYELVFLSPGTRERTDLRDGYSTLFGKFLFGFFTGVGVGQVGVEILIQDLCGLFAEVAPFASVETQTSDTSFKQRYNLFLPSPVYWMRMTCLPVTLIHTGQALQIVEGEIKCDIYFLNKMCNFLKNPLRHFWTIKKKFSQNDLYS